MKKITVISRVLCIAAIAASLSACQTMDTPKVAAPVKPKLEDMLARATEAKVAGKQEQAITLWKETATAYPADKSPWVNIAQSRYDAGQYGEAIVSAQEILVRDPSDQLANSIIAISGLRLSTRALGDLSRQNNLSGSIRTESQDLAKLLRESLGETVLVPNSDKKPQTRTSSTSTANAAANAVRSRAQAVKPPVSTPSADPFGALK
jgi:tetratricopeptide (TPR) repeat protein